MSLHLRRLLAALAVGASLLVLAGRAAEAWACPYDGWPRHFAARVVAVKDGDTLVIRNPGFGQGPRERTLRLHGIDAPEHDQPFGREARQWLRERVQREVVEFEVLATDRYCRYIVRARHNRLSLEHALVAAGLAWHDPRNADAALAQAEAAARAARRGLWAEADPVPPQLWRKARRSRTQGAAG
jgi:endonuclease YncB( thermonuclease family)